MIKAFFLPVCLCMGAFAIGQPGTHLQIAGRNLIGTCGDTITLKGINYAPYNWGYSASENYFDEIARTGANCVRLVWYKNSVSAIYNNLSYLDSALARCVRAGMLPILELHDATCSGNMANVTALLPFYTSVSFKALELKYRQHLIVNIANEAGYYAWSSNPANALQTYKTTYQNAITTLRNNGLQVPLMIDAPDCGANSDAIVNAGAEMLAADPLANTLFSVHGYWYGFTGNNVTAMGQKVQALYQSGLCVFFGEIANLQDDASPCQYNLAYVDLLGILKNYQTGWAAWSWYHDVCTARQISNNGTAGNLSAFGQVIVNHPDFGLKTTAKQPLQLKPNCGDTCSLMAGALSGPLNGCRYIGSGMPVTYSLPPVVNAASVKWTLPARSTALSYSTDSLSVTLLLQAGFELGTTAQKQIKIRVISRCGNNTERLLAISTAKPAVPAYLSGTSNACLGMAPDLVTYKTGKVANATGYLWNIPPVGATIVSHPAGTGENDTVIQVQYNTNYPITPNPLVDFISVAATSPCGTSLPKKLLVTRTGPSAAGTLSGPADVCTEIINRLDGIESSVTYSIKKIPNAGYYLWTVPTTGATIISHPGGTAMHDTAIKVSFSTDLPAAGGKITVKGINGCSTGAEKSITVSAKKVLAPAAITGTETPCPGATEVYTCTTVTHATGYSWTLPQNAVIISGQGTAQITVQYPASEAQFKTGYVRVKALSPCGNSATRSLAITKCLPMITGILNREDIFIGKE